MKSGVVLLAAGSGRRFGGRQPKQFLFVNGKPLFFLPLKTFLEKPSVKEVVIVGAPVHRAKISRWVAAMRTNKPIAVVDGGAIRGESVRNGVQALSNSVDVVLVHDSARPLVSRDIIDRVEKAAKRTGAALAAWPLADTLKLATPSLLVKKTIPREKLWLAQTPQGFRRDVAQKCLMAPSAGATDDVELAQRKGYKVAIVEGSATNFKVTYPTDLTLCRLLQK